MVKNQGLTREEWINYDYKKVVTNKELSTFAESNCIFSLISRNVEMYSILQKNPNGDFFVLSHLSIFRETVWF
jgi:hypothetical protein